MDSKIRRKPSEEEEEERKTWMDDSELDLRNVGLKRLRKRVLDRTEGLLVMKEANGK